MRKPSHPLPLGPTKNSGSPPILRSFATGADSNLSKPIPLYRLLWQPGTCFQPQCPSEDKHTITAFLQRQHACNWTNGSAFKTVLHQVPDKDTTVLLADIENNCDPILPRTSATTRTFNFPNNLCQNKLFRETLGPYSNNLPIQRAFMDLHLISCGRPFQKLENPAVSG